MELRAEVLEAVGEVDERRKWSGWTKWKRIESSEQMEWEPSGWQGKVEQRAKVE